MQLYDVINKNGTKLVVSDLGATVMSLSVRDRKGQVTDIVLGYAGEEQYFEDEYYLNTMVGRYANRIAGGDILIEGIPYRLAVRNGGYHLHGGDSGFNKKKFVVETFSNRHSSGVVLKYMSPHLEEGFPGNLSLEVTYTLDDDDQWTVEYRADTDQTTIVNFTQHCYFNLSGRTASTVEDHQIKINGNLYLPVNDMQVPTGSMEEVKNTPFDFTSFRKIGQQIDDRHPQLLRGGGYDHSWVLEKNHTHTLKHAASVKEDSTGIHLDVFTTEPAVHFYSGNYLKETKAKNNTIFNKRSGFCLETQHFPDSPNHAQFPSTVLKANESFYSKTIFKISVE